MSRICAARQFICDTGPVVWQFMTGCCCILILPFHASAQVVQLPTWRAFSVDTAVLVPDRGGAVVGGVGHAAGSRIKRRLPRLSMPPFAARASHQAFGSGQFGVSATIIDHRQWDEAMLTAARMARQATPPPSAVERKAAWLTRHVERQAREDVGRSSVAQLRRHAKRQAATEQRARDREAATLLQHGDACRDRGQLSAARIFYRSAWRQSQGEQRRVAARRLARLPVAHAAAARSDGRR